MKNMPQNFLNDSMERMEKRFREQFREEQLVKFGKTKPSKTSQSVVATEKRKSPPNAE